MENTKTEVGLGICKHSEGVFSLRRGLLRDPGFLDYDREGAGEKGQRYEMG